jgi:Flp pilus assembly protein TadG
MIEYGRVLSRRLIYSKVSLLLKERKRFLASGKKSHGILFQEVDMGAGRRDKGRVRGVRNGLWGGKAPAQALVELALILPILTVLIVGALEFGRLWSTKLVLTNAAREGAYYYSTHGETNPCPDGLTRTAAKNEASGSGIALSDAEIKIEGNCTSGSNVKVTTSHTVTDLLVLGFVGNVFHLTGSLNSFTLSSYVNMMVQ